MKKMWITIVVILALVGLWASKNFLKKSTENDKSSISKAEVAPSFWTCPMHPQIHADHPGECPICHMKLVEVKAKKAESGEATKEEKRSSVQISEEQIGLVGIQRHSTEKMNLKIKIPVSGRFISSSAVVFQIYESDIRYVKAGVAFIGESSFYSEDEIQGTVSSVDSIVDPTSRTIRVVGSIKKGPRGVVSDTGFRGQVELEIKDRIAIPESSVVHTGDGDLVYIFSENNKLTPKVVKLGIKSEGFYDVLSGLSAGETISSGPNFLIDSEAKIRGLND